LNLIAHSVYIHGEAVLPAAARLPAGFRLTTCKTLRELWQLNEIDSAMFDRQQPLKLDKDAAFAP